MNTMHEDLARAHMSTRLGEAHERQRGRQLVMARRLSRRAERAAQQARANRRGSHLARAARLTRRAERANRRAQELLSRAL